MLLQSEKYAGLIIALLSHGEKIANGSEGDAGKSCSQEVAEEWKCGLCAEHKVGETEHVGCLLELFLSSHSFLRL